MNYLTLENVTRRYGEKLLFENINMHIDKGQKIGLIAKNGSGKTTLLKVIGGEEGSEGENSKILLHKSIRVGRLQQEPDFPATMDVLGAVLDDSGNAVVAALHRYEKALLNPDDTAELQAAMVEMDDRKAWTFEAKVKEMLSRFNLSDFTQKVGILSGGQKKRLALVRLLLQEPDFLILDEPTNHLDVEMIEWLEEYLQQPSITLFMVTHDRYFLENICDSIIELDGGKLLRYSGSYSDYLEKKAHREEVEATTFQRQKKLLKTELDWVRRSPAARTSKSKARVDSYYNRMEANEELKKKDEQLTLAIKENYLGSKIVEFHNVSKGFGEKNLIEGFSYKFRRRERVGIVGQNGTGKSTFLDLATKVQEPDTGKVIKGDTIKFGHYRQDGIKLENDKRVIDVVRDIADVIPLEKGKTMTAAQLLERFLFPRPQQQVYVSQLSGGEKRRLYLLTVLMANPNFLILDEPTNDLDVMTLQVLEDFLKDFPGCLVVVTHDRYFMDRLVEHLFVFEGNGVIRDFNGTYVEYRMKKEQETKQKRAETASQPKEEKQSISAKQYGLSKSEKNEMRGLERDIEKMEKRKKDILEKLGDASLDLDTITSLSKELGEIGDTLDEKEMRWLELDELK